MNAFEKWSVWITSVLTGLTGVGYFWAKHLVEPGDPFAVVNHPLQPWFLKAHILVSPLLLLALGTILVRHVWQHVRLGVTWGRKSGLLTGGVLLPMIVTGYLIQAVTHQGWLAAVIWAHVVTGVAYLVGIVLHQVAVAFCRPDPGERRTRRNGKGSAPAARSPGDLRGHEDAASGAGTGRTVRPSPSASAERLGRGAAPGKTPSPAGTPEAGRPEGNGARAPSRGGTGAPRA